MPFAHNVMPMLLLVTGAAATASCSKVPDRPVTGSQQLEESSQQLVWDSTPAMKRTPAEQVYVNEREQMVAVQLASRDIVEQRVLDAMNQVPRHEFVPAAIRHLAYNDSPLPIGHQQTISQPYIVALMTQLVEPQPHMKALDIGTGSGYQAAVLAELVKNVYSIEIVEPLAKEARERLQVLGYKDITIRHGDGYQGWKSEAPFDIIIVAAAPDHVPQPLVDQLAPEGKMVIPVGKHFQNLLVIEKQQGRKRRSEARGSGCFRSHDGRGTTVGIISDGQRALPLALVVLVLRPPATPARLASPAVASDYQPSRNFQRQASSASTLNRPVQSDPNSAAIHFRRCSIANCSA